MIGGNLIALLNPVTYLFLLGFIISQSFWLYRLNRGLAEFDALFIIPVMQVQWTLLSVLEGLIYFQEYKQWGGPIEPCVFFLALAISFSGVYLLSSGGGLQQLSRGGGDYKPIEDIEPWDHTDPKSPGVIMPHGVRKMDQSALQKFGVLLMVTRSASGASWELNWLKVSCAATINTNRSLSPCRAYVFPSSFPFPRCICVRRCISPYLARSADCFRAGLRLGRLLHARTGTCAHIACSV